jgi:hypothetical protein
MEEWQTIWDHETAAFGKRNMTFAGSNGDYRVAADELDQDNILVSFRGGTVPWAVYVKSTRNGVFRLQGMAPARGSPHDDNSYWFELTLTEPAVLRYYGDRVLVHEDHEVPTDT